MTLSKKKLIGITGGIGSGKSRVSRFWSSFADLPLINIDSVCAQLLENGNAGWQAVKKEFDESFFHRDGQLDRKRLRTAIFSDAKVRRQINALIHPLALVKMLEAISQCEKEDVLVDVPLLFEAGWEDHFDCRVVVFADTSVCCQRIVERDRVDLDEAGRTVLSQLPLPDKIMRADHVINNSGSWVSTILEIIHLARLISSEKKDKQI